MLCAWEVVDAIRGRLKDIPFYYWQNANLSGTEKSSSITCSGQHYFKVGMEVELCPTVNGEITALEAGLITAISTSAEILTVQRGYHNTSRTSATSGATSGYFIVGYDFFSNKFIVDAFNHVVKDIFPHIHWKTRLNYNSSVDTLTGNDAGTWWSVATFPEGAQVYEVYGYNGTSAAMTEIYRIPKWEMMEPFGTVRSRTATTLGHDPVYDEMAFHAEDGSIQREQTIFMPQDYTTDYSGFFARLMCPLPRMPYDIHNHRTSYNAVYGELLPADYLRIISLGVEIECFKSMLMDRDKYERYVTTAWNQAVAPYELSNHIAILEKEFDKELDRKTLTVPRVRRRVNS